MSPLPWIGMALCHKKTFGRGSFFPASIYLEWSAHKSSRDNAYLAPPSATRELGRARTWDALALFPHRPTRKNNCSDDGFFRSRLLPIADQDEWRPVIRMGMTGLRVRGEARWGISLVTCRDRIGCPARFVRHRGIGLPVEQRQLRLP
jgi:hypothetical protein